MTDLPFQDGAFLRAYACRDQKMPISPFLFIKCLVGNFFHFSTCHWVHSTHICMKATSLLVIGNWNNPSLFLRLWSINWPAVLKRWNKTTESFDKKIKTIYKFIKILTYFPNSIKMYWRITYVTHHEKPSMHTIIYCDILIAAQIVK